jgi:uncharacterized protein
LVFTLYFDFYRVEKIVIAGGSGLVGQKLTSLLTNNGYKVAWLSHSRKTNSREIECFYWDAEKGIVENGAFQNTSIVINLAGENIASKRWTKEYKQDIYNSRVNSARLLVENLTSSVNTFLQASAIGYYGLDTGTKIVHEGSPQGHDFLASTVADLEREVFSMTNPSTRVICFRLGVVLSNKGGALPKMATPFRYGLGCKLGTGHQYFSWIDIDDLCSMFLFALKNHEVSGIYNAVAPNPITNSDFSESLSSIVQKPIWLPNAPNWLLNTVLGEMANTLTGGNRVSSQKISTKGFHFKRPLLLESLKHHLITSI